MKTIFSTTAIAGVVLAGLIGARILGPGGAAIGIIIGDIGGGMPHNLRHRTSPAPRSSRLLEH